MAAFGAIGLAAVLAVGLRIANAEPAASDVIRVTTTPADGVVDISFGGDTFLGDGAQPLIEAVGMDPLLAKAAPLLDGEVRIVNAEGPITAVSTPANPGQKFSYAADPAAAGALARAGINVLNLANNHVMDRGPVGMLDTQANATAAGIRTVGAGRTAAEAERPLIVSSPSETVAVVAFGDYFGALYRASESGPGIISLTPDHIQRGVELARGAGADRLIAFVHWGDNYSNVNAQQRYWAGLLIDAGFDVIIGAGSHVIQPVEVVKGKPVAFSLGNFVFGTPGRFDTFGQVGQGLTATVRFTGDAHGNLTFTCLDTDNTAVKYVSRPCTATTVKTAQATVGPAVTWNGNTGQLPF